MKRNSIAILLAALVLLALATPALAAPPVRISYNGASLVSDVPPMVVGGRTLVPARLISEALGADVSWDARTRTATVVKGQQVITLTAGSTQATRNGAPVRLDAPATIHNGRLMLPLRFFAENFGATVGWDAATRTALVDFRETRDGKTAAQYLAEAAAALNIHQSYKFAGDMSFTVSGTQNGLSQSMNMGMTMAGASRPPLETYMTMTMHAPQTPSVPAQSTTMEVFFDGSQMWMKAPGQEWQSTPLPVSQQALINQSAINQSPDQILRQIEQFGIVTGFGNDVTENGTTYTVVVAKLDQQKYLAGMREMLQDPQSSLSSGEAAQFEEAMRQLFGNMTLDFSYRLYVNQATRDMEKVRLLGYLGMDMGEGAAMRMDLAFALRMYDFDQPVTFPQVP